MAYRIDPGEPPAAQIRRIAADGLDSALQRLRDPDADGLERTVHAVRKSCKRLRSLLRMVRPALGPEYSRTNATVREAAAVLSSLRDAHAVLATFDSLLAARRDLVPASGLNDVRAALAERAATAADPDEVRDQLDEAAAKLASVRACVAEWALPGDLRPAIRGAAAYHGMARAAFRQSRRDRSDERLHEWRKRVKDVWYHTQLLTLLAPSALAPAERVLSGLSDGLGNNNDLAVLGRALRDSPDQLGGDQAHEALLITEQVRDDLIVRCWALGARVHAEPEGRYHQRLRRYAKAYSMFGEERRVGEIGAIYGRDPA